MWWFSVMVACPSSEGDLGGSDDAPTAPDTPGLDTGAVEPCAVPRTLPAGPAVRLERPPKNVLVLSIDTLRRDYVDFYDCPEPTVSRMPFLTSLLAASVSVEDVQQCSNWTFPSTNCTLSGTLIEEMAHVPRFGPQGRPVPDGQRTMATLLRDAGFFTGLVHSNGWFDRIVDERHPDDELTGNAQGYARRVRAGGALSVGDAGVNMMRDALAEGADRWLLHLHFIEPHDLYLAPDSLIPELAELPPIPVAFRSRQSFVEAQSIWPSLSPEEQALYRDHFQLRYTGDLRLLDGRMQTVWAQLQDEGLLDDTLVVIWTDHGEAFWERGHQAHGWRLGAEETDALLAFWHPALEPVRVEGPYHAIDFLPTTVAALGLPVPDDLRGVEVGTAAPDRVRFAATSNIVYRRFQSVTQGGLKLTVGWDGTATLHDRDVDPREVDDRFAPTDPRVAALWSLLEPRVRMLEARIPEGQRVEWAALEARFTP